MDEFSLWIICKLYLWIIRMIVKKKNKNNVLHNVISLTCIAVFPQFLIQDDGKPLVKLINLRMLLFTSVINKRAEKLNCSSFMIWKLDLTTKRATHIFAVNPSCHLWPSGSFHHLVPLDQGSPTLFLVGYRPAYFAANSADQLDLIRPVSDWLSTPKPGGRLPFTNWDIYFSSFMYEHCFLLLRKLVGFIHSL